jgi:hypothetical protein
MVAGVVIAASPALAADLPHRKPGLWEVKYFHGAPIQYCIDAAVDKVTLGIAGPLNPDECKKIDTQRSGDAVDNSFTPENYGAESSAYR